jgi:uncharacterized protein YbaP (TraB family)
MREYCEMVRGIGKRILTVSVFALCVAGFATHVEAACVWKVTGPNGGTLYLGGSVHALKSTDYPLPAAYNRAFDASSRLVIEDDPNVSPATIASFRKSAEYPKGDSLKNHLDPRTYDYLRRVFGLMHVPEEKYSKLRPWALILNLWSPSLHGMSGDLGIEGFLQRRAKANAKPVSGLESFHEHMDIMSGMPDQQAERVLLTTFIPHGNSEAASLISAWRRGDVDGVARLNRESFQDLPSFYERLIPARNRNWIPKIEEYLRSGQVYFVVAGAAHMGGSEGVIAMLKARGCHLEQL